MSDAVKIVKVGQEPKKPESRKSRKSKSTAKKLDHSKKPKFGILKKGKTARRKPRFEAVRDPTSSPPLRILTHKGEKTRRNEIERQVRGMSPHNVRETLRRNNLPVTSNKKEIIDEIYVSAKVAGMLSER